MIKLRASMYSNNEQTALCSVYTSISYCKRERDHVLFILCMFAFEGFAKRERECKISRTVGDINVGPGLFAVCDLIC